MCTKKILYQPGNKGRVALRAKETGDKLSFKQICYTTDCVLAYANAKDISISKAAEELADKGAFPKIYRAARKREPLPYKLVAKQFY